MFITKNLKFLKLKEYESELEKDELDVLFGIYYSPSHTAKFNLRYYSPPSERFLNRFDRKLRDKRLLESVDCFSIRAFSLSNDFSKIREYRTLVDRGLIKASVRGIEKDKGFRENCIKVDLSIKKNKLGKVICLLVAYAWEREYVDICGEVKKLMDLSIVSI